MAQHLFKSIIIICDDDNIQKFPAFFWARQFHRGRRFYIKKRDNNEIDDLCSTSKYTFYNVLSFTKMVLLFKTECTEENLYVQIVSDIFLESFVVVDKYIYNKSTLINIGLVNDLGHCFIRRLVIINYENY